MASLEIKPEELSGIDTNQIASMQLKDGTIIMINEAGETQAQGEEEFIQEEQVQEEQAQEEQAQEEVQTGEVTEEQGQENQLRARPMPVKMVPVRPVIAPGRKVVPVPVRPVVAPVRKVVPVPVKPIVAPVRPLLPKPMVVPRGPMLRPAGGVFRARPGMPFARPAVVAPKVVPVPVHRPPVVKVPIHKPPMLPPKPGMLMKQGVLKPNPFVAQKYGFRARPNVEQEEEGEAEYQQEEVSGEEEVAGEEQYCECEGEEECQEDNLRARPMMMMPPRRHMPPPMRPRMVPVPPPMFPHRRGPMMGYNTFQPRVFRARPRPRVVPVPMFTPLNTTFQPKIHRHGMRGPGYRPYPPMGPVYLRGKERSNSYDAEEQAYEECDQQCETQKCTKSICTKCGKEF